MGIPTKGFLTFENIHRRDLQKIGIFHRAMNRHESCGIAN